MKLVNLLGVCSIFLVLVSCADYSEEQSILFDPAADINSEKSEQIELGMNADSFSLGCYINGIPAPVGSCEAPDGLILLGSFDANKESVVFTHGWIPEYEMGVPDFPNAASWQAKGYNTFIYRYIRKASDPGDGARCNAGGVLYPILGVAEFNCPKDAEPRVWETGGSGEALVDGYKSFFNQYPNYNKEVRMVGHSLGAQVVTYATYRLHAENYGGQKPTRLELIDPFVGSAIADTGELPLDLNYPVPSPTYLPGSPCDSNNSDTIYCVMENSLNNLKNTYNLGIAVYGSVSSGAFSYDFRKFFHYQSFSGDWLCSEFFWSGSPKCTVRNFSVFTAQHFFPLLSYFWSIDESIPSNGYSAKTPTSTFQGPIKWKRQYNSGNYCNLQNGKKFWEEGGVDHVFGAARYDDDGIGNGYQVIAWSRSEMKRRLQAQLGFSSSKADRCAKAISWSNDNFYDDNP